MALDSRRLNPFVHCPVSKAVEIVPSSPSFYRSDVESILSYCITEWISGHIKKTGNGIIKTLAGVTGSQLPRLEDINKIASTRRVSANEGHWMSHSSMIIAQTMVISRPGYSSRNKCQRIRTLELNKSGLTLTLIWLLRIYDSSTKLHDGYGNSHHGL